MFRNSVRYEMKKLLSMSEIPSDDVLESLHKLRIRESDELKTVLELYDMEIHQKISMPNDQQLKTIVKRRKDQKLRLRNFDARQGKSKQGKWSRVERAQVALKEGEVFVTRGKKKASVRRETSQCSFRHDAQDRAQKPEHTAATPSEPTVSRGRSVSSK